LKEKPNWTKTKICKQWQRNGICNEGEHCSFAHGEENLRHFVDVSPSLFRNDISKEDASVKWQPKGLFGSQQLLRFSDSENRLQDFGDGSQREALWDILNENVETYEPSGVDLATLKSPSEWELKNNAPFVLPPVLESIWPYLVTPVTHIQQSKARLSCNPESQMWADLDSLQFSKDQKSSMRTTLWHSDLGGTKTIYDKGISSKNEDRFISNGGNIQENFVPDHRDWLDAQKEQQQFPTILQLLLEQLKILGKDNAVKDLHLQEKDRHVMILEMAASQQQFEIAKLRGHISSILKAEIPKEVVSPSNEASCFFGSGHDGKFQLGDTTAYMSPASPTSPNTPSTAPTPSAVNEPDDGPRTFVSELSEALQ